MNKYLAQVFEYLAQVLLGHVVVRAKQIIDEAAEKAEIVEKLRAPELPQITYRQ